jgi:hypothetical protein
METWAPLLSNSSEAMAVTVNTSVRVRVRVTVMREVRHALYILQLPQIQGINFTSTAKSPQWELNQLQVKDTVTDMQREAVLAMKRNEILSGNQLFHGTTNLLQEPPLPPSLRIVM